jgi:hypothetical protein
VPLDVHHHRLSREWLPQLGGVLVRLWVWVGLGFGLGLGVELGVELGVGVGVGLGFHSCVVSLHVKHRSWILSQPQCSAVIAKGDMCTHMPSTLSR